MVADMTTAVLRRTAGQLFMVGLPGPELDPESREFLREYTPGGVVLFKRNVTSAGQLRRLVSDVKGTGAGVEPLVAIDHEGGRVHRLPRPFTHFPPALTVAAGGPAAARRVGRAMGTELAAVGIDIDFAPVLDVWTNPRNTVIGDRAFGTTPASAARNALALAPWARRAWCRAGSTFRDTAARRATRTTCARAFAAAAGSWRRSIWSRFGARSARAFRPS